MVQLKGCLVSENIVDSNSVHGGNYQRSSSASVHKTVYAWTGQKHETYAFLLYDTYRLTVSHIPFFFFMKLEKRDTKKKKKLHNLMKKSITTYRGIKKEDRPKFSREETMHLVYYMHRSFTIITYGLI